MNLTSITGEEFQLQRSINFVNHYNSPHSAASVIIRQFNEDNLYDFLKEYKDLKIIDIGANVGLFSLYVSPVAETVYAIEPTPSHFSLLNEVLLTTDVKNIEPHQLGVYTENGTIDFNIHDINSTMNSFVRHKSYPHGETTVQVQTKTLSSLIDDLGCGVVDFVKMDIEGLEAELILHPSFQTVKDKVRAYHIEVHDFEGTADEQGKIDNDIINITRVFEQWGKRVVRINNDSILVH
tara:strand:+ start:301 stop:1011 length:711 start_codon:yes stop_codon:yes gene_type:complete